MNNLQNFRISTEGEQRLFLDTSLEIHTKKPSQRFVHLNPFRENPFNLRKVAKNIHTLVQLKLNNRGFFSENAGTWQDIQTNLTNFKTRLENSNHCNTRRVRKAREFLEQSLLLIQSHLAFKENSSDSLFTFFESSQEEQEREQKELIFEKDYIFGEDQPEESNLSERTNEGRKIQATPTPGEISQSFVDQGLYDIYLEIRVTRQIQKLTFSYFDGRYLESQSDEEELETKVFADLSKDSVFYLNPLVFANRDFTISITKIGSQTSETQQITYSQEEINDHISENFRQRNFLQLIIN
jgi:hypothetical protein